MKHVKYLFVLSVCLLIFCSCDKKQHAIDDLSNFVEKVEKNAPDYSDEDWAKVNKEYEEITAEIDKYDYSGDETKRIAELKGKFVGIKTKDSVRDIIDGVDKAVQDIKGTVKGIKDGFLGNEVQPLTNETDSSGTNN